MPYPLQWEAVVDLIHAVFREGHFAEECTWKTVVLIPKENNDFFRIGLVEVLWKKVMGILNFCLTKAIQLHKMLHGFLTDRGTRTASLEYNLPQHVIDIREELLFKIFLDLHKAYDSLYHERCLDILEVYGVGHWALYLLWRYWDRLNMAAQDGG